MIDPPSPSLEGRKRIGATIQPFSFREWLKYLRLTHSFTPGGKEKIQTEEKEWERRRKRGAKTTLAKERGEGKVQLRGNRRERKRRRKVKSFWPGSRLLLLGSREEKKSREAKKTEVLGFFSSSSSSAEAELL